MVRIVAVHGTATSGKVWHRFAAALPDHEVVAVERPRTGSLDLELAWLHGQAAGAWVVGMSGGATLGLALASRPHRALGMVLHEPAVGSLAPGLLAPVATAFERGGAAELARTLYGEGWTADLLGEQSETTVAAELAMFRSFEPGPPRSPVPVVVTVGGDSPPARHQAAAVLAPLGYTVQTIPGTQHFVGHDHPLLLAEVIRRLVG